MRLGVSLSDINNAIAIEDAWRHNTSFDNLSTRGGLLYVGNRERPIGTSSSDIIARQFGFIYAERLVAYLEMRQHNK